MSRRARQSMNNRNRRRRTRSQQSRRRTRSQQSRRRTRSQQSRRRTRSQQSRRSNRRQQSRRSNRRQQSMSSRSSSASTISARRRPTTILDTRGISIPRPSLSTSFKEPQPVNPEQLVEGKFYYIKFSGLHRSEHSSMFAGIYDGEGAVGSSGETARFTNVWRMVPQHMREDYNTWVHLEFDFEFSIDKHYFYAIPSEYSKWVSVQNQLARDSKLRDVMLYNTYLEVFGQGDHARYLVHQSKEAMQI